MEHTLFMIVLTCAAIMMVVGVAATVGLALCITAEYLAPKINRLVNWLKK